MAYNPNAEKFIQNLTKYYRLDGMSSAYRAGLKKLYDKGIAGKERDEWKAYITAIDKGPGNEPDDIKFSKLDPDDQKVVYKWLQDMLYTMKSDDRLMGENKAAKKFVDDYYIDTCIQPYSVKKLDDSGEAAQQFADSIKQHSSVYLQFTGPEFKDELDKIQKALSNDTYYKDPNVARSFISFLYKIQNIFGQYNITENYRQQLLKILPDCVKTKTDRFDDPNFAIQLGKYLEDNIDRFTQPPFNLNKTDLDKLAAHLSAGKSSDDYLTNLLNALKNAAPKSIPQGVPIFLRETLDYELLTQLGDYLNHGNNGQKICEQSGLNSVNELLPVIKKLQAGEQPTDEPLITNLGKALDAMKDLAAANSLPYKNKLPKQLKTNGNNLNIQAIDGLKKLLSEVNISKDTIDNYTNITTTTLDDDKLNDYITKLNERTEPEINNPVSLDEPLQNMFKELVNNKKLRDVTITKQSDIQTQFNKGLEKSDYENGEKTKVQPAYTDKKSLFLDAKDKIKDYYHDTLGKFRKKHARHVYSTKANIIVEALLNKGISPADGAAKLLDTLTEIQGKLDGSVSGQAKWAVETLSKFKDKDFFKHSLRNGSQMNALVSEIIKAAAHDKKEDEAMVLLELLAVMRYTSTTSSIRDKLHKMDFVLFSDPNISLNKENSFIQSFMKGVDATLKYTMLGAFEVANIIKNKYNERGLKFKKGSEKLDKRIKDSVEYKDKDKDRQVIMEKLMGFWNAVNNSRVSKDYKLFKKHSTVQKAADQEHKKKITIKLAGRDVDIDAKTEQEINVYEYIKEHNIGRNG